MKFNRIFRYINGGIIKQNDYQHGYFDSIPLRMIQSPLERLVFVNIDDITCSELHPNQYVSQFLWKYPHFHWSTPKLTWMLWMYWHDVDITVQHRYPCITCVLQWSYQYWYWFILIGHKTNSPPWHKVMLGYPLVNCYITMENHQF